MPSNWLSLVPVCDAYAYNAALICEDCGAKTIEELEAKGIEDTGDSNDFPQGPIGDNESDSPGHCDNNEYCINAVKVPGGKKIGCPLQTTLTEDGCNYVRDKIAENILFGNPHQKAVGRLWLHLYNSSIGHVDLIPIITQPIPTYRGLKTALSAVIKSGCQILPKVFTDLEYVYGAAVHTKMDTGSLILWRLSLTDTGKFDEVNTVELPISEENENTMTNMLTEAVSEGAWD
jgi:hypothetical protein